jgi:hypothetical protein
VFVGDPLQYPDWKASFSALIENKGIPAADRIHYLKRYLGGPAREAVSGFFLLRSEEAYRQAKNTLEERYGNRFVTSEAFLAKLHGWPKVPSKNKSALLKFSDFVNQCNVAQQEFSTLKHLNEIKEIQRVAQRLPDWALLRWNRKVAGKRREKGTYPDFAEFAEFVRVEADIANDPALQSGPQPPAAAPHRTSANSSIHRTFLTNGGQPAQECRFCKRKNHKTSDCRAFAKKTMDERRKYVKKERLCFGCLERDHMSKNCKRRSECSKCKKNSA